MKKSFFDMNEVGKVYLWSFILPQILFLVFQFVLMAVGENSGQSVDELLQITPIYISYLMVSQISFFLVFMFFSKNTNWKKAVKLDFKFGWLNTIICVLIGIIGIFALSPVVNLFNDFLGVIGYELSSGFFYEMSSPFMLILSIILIAGVPAVVEELIFRGIIFQGLRKFGNLTAIFGTSALFALIHLSAQQLIYPFLFSIVLCYIVLKTNSILASMIVHFVANAVSIICTYFSFNFAINVDYWLFVLIALGAVALGAGIVYLLTKLLKNVEKEKTADEVLKELEVSEKLPEYNSNPYSLKLGIVIAVVLWIINFIYCLAI